MLGLGENVSACLRPIGILRPTVGNLVFCLTQAPRLLALVSSAGAI